MSETAEPLHDAIQDAMRDASDHDDILTRYVLVSEWIGPEGVHYLSLGCGVDTKSWHARGMLAEGVAMIDQGDTFDTVLQAITPDDDEDE